MAQLIANKEDFNPASLDKYRLIANEVNQLFTEFNNVLSSASITPSSSDLTQLRQAINSMIDTKIAGKQGTLTPGTGISISGNNTISVTNAVAMSADVLKLAGGTMNNGATIALKNSAGTITATLGVDTNSKAYLSSSTGSSIKLGTTIELTTVSSARPLVNNNQLAYLTDIDNKQDKLTAGEGIDITNNVISADIQAIVPTKLSELTNDMGYLNYETVVI